MLLLWNSGDMRRWWPLALSWCCSGIPVAAAQPNTSGATSVVDGSAVTPEARGQAQRYFQAGLSLQKTDDFEAAIAAYETSLRLYPTKSAMFNLANCQRAQRRYADAWASLKQLHQTFGNELVEPMLSTSIAQLEELENLTALFTVVSDPPGAAVVMDGKPLNPTPWGAPVRLTIGAHSIELRSEGYRPVSASVTLTPRQEESRVFRLEPLAAAAVAGVKEPTPVTPGPAPKSPVKPDSRELGVDREPKGLDWDGSRPTFGWLTVAAGAASVGVGAWLGARALDVDDQLAAACDSGHCSASAAPRIERLERLTTAANVWIGAGVALAAVGVTLVLWPTEDVREQVTLQLRPASLVVETAF